MEGRQHTSKGAAEAVHGNGSSFTATGLPHIAVSVHEDRYSVFQRFSPRCRSFSQVHDMETSGALDIESAAANVNSPVSTERYFDALQGPELEILKETENTVILPLDQTWPFLLRFPINAFSIVLGLGNQTILWKALTTVDFVHIPKMVNFVLWCITLCVFVLIFCTYVTKCIFYFEAVRREFFHPVRVNYFFAPWIGAMFLTIGVPTYVSSSIHWLAVCFLVVPLLALELKIYGQWLSGGDRRLSKVANPTSHLSIAGNFVGAILSGQVGLKEPAIFLWAVGIAHYFVLFVTLYQRLPTNMRLPKDLHPVFFLFVAAPSTASVAWKYITGEFGYVSRLVYFNALFLLLSLVVRLKFFWGFRFSVSWWAYTFPLGACAIAAIHYHHEVNGTFTSVLVVILTLVSAVVVLTVFVLTLFHAFLWGTLFPNDLAVAITRERKQKKEHAQEYPKPEAPAAA